MEKINLTVENRDKSISTKNLRKERIVPGVVYGHKQEPISVQLGASEMLKTYRKAGENHVITLNVDKKKIDVLIHNTQKHPVSGDFTHVDFIALVAGEKVHTHIPLVFTGESQAKKDGALIEEHMHELEVKCLATDLVDNFEVSLETLEKVGDSVKVGDLTIDNKFDVLSSEDSVVVSADKVKEQKIEDDVVEETTEEGAEETTEES